MSLRILDGILTPYKIVSKLQFCPLRPIQTMKGSLLIFISLPIL